MFINEIIWWIYSYIFCSDVIKFCVILYERKQILLTSLEYKWKSPQSALKYVTNNTFAGYSTWSINKTARTTNLILQVHDKIFKGNNKSKFPVAKFEATVFTESQLNKAMDTTSELCEKAVLSENLVTPTL